MILIDGRKAREYYLPILKEKISKLNTVPCLVIIQVGNRADSDAFIKAKKSFAKKIGAKEIHIQFGNDVKQEEVIKGIQKYNMDSSVHGIIVQLPLPEHLNADEIIQNINPKKDVDGLTLNTKYTPATARGVLELLNYYQVSLKEKKVTVMGRSKLVGTPIAHMCRKEGAMVTVCHSETENIPEKTKEADILIVAIGKPKLVDERYVKSDTVVIDVGITRYLEEGLVGDVNFEKVKDIVSMITPVPGGVGQMTVLALFENLVDSCYNV